MRHGPKHGGARKGAGRHKHQPSDSDRLRVKLAHVAGVRGFGIARMLGIDEKTLRQYYRHELDSAVDEILTLAMGVVAKKVKDGDFAAAMRVLERKGDWAMTSKVELTGKDGKPIEVKSTEEAARALALVTDPNLAAQTYMDLVQAGGNGDEATKH